VVELWSEFDRLGLMGQLTGEAAAEQEGGI
jgi:hypothetical protein